jgi:hypothetical protein
MNGDAGMPVRHAVLILLGSWVLLLSGCREQTAPDSPEREPRVEDMSWGQVEFVVTADPPVVEYDKDILLTLRMVTPAHIEAAFPFVADRLEGFVLNGSFEGDPVTVSGKTTREQHVRLTPRLAQEYRIAPMAVIYEDRSTQPPHEGWFATRAMIFEALQPGGASAESIKADLDPVWIHPSPGTILLYVLLGALGIAAVFGITRLARRAQRAVQLRRMSPRERALSELTELLAAGLVEANETKEFYVRLTMIVRHYIERQHAVRAPEQTTEEFLAAVSEDPRFGREVVLRLREFLEAADLVKFAAYLPDSNAVEKSTRTARNYIEEDSAAARALDGAPSAKGGR